MIPPATAPLVSGSSGTGYPVFTDTATIIGPGIGPTSGSETIDGPGAAASLHLSGFNVFDGIFNTGFTQIDDPAAAGLTLQTGTLTASQELIVGARGLDTLSLASGALVQTTGTAVQLEIGQNAGSDGLVTIGAGATLDLAGPAQNNVYAAYVGHQGNGTLDVLGTMDTGGNSLAIGDGTGNSGSVLVSQGGTPTAGTDDKHGNVGVAIAVGRLFSNATITITDPGSSVTANGNMYVGRGGTGTLIVENHGVLTAGATEGGTGGTLNIGLGNTSYVGGIGGSGSATITNHGTVDDLGVMTIGGQGVNGAVSVDDGGLLTVQTDIHVGLGVINGGTYYTGSARSTWARAARSRCRARPAPAPTRCRSAFPPMGAARWMCRARARCSISAITA
ncbi:MAG TPA: hypothetical protein VGF84_24065 [Micromonosporaceae bacterium]